jgi:hypothetical protein
MSGDVRSWNGGNGAFSEASQWAVTTTPGNTVVTSPGALDSASFAKGGSLSGSGNVAAMRRSRPGARPDTWSVSLRTDRTQARAELPDRVACNPPRR